MSEKRTVSLAACAVLSACCSISAAPRDVQIRSVDIANGIIELFNFGSGNQSLSGWRFCTFDDNESFRYTSSVGLTGRSIASMTSFFVHVKNDAPAEPDHIDLSALGGFFAAPLDSGPFALSLYSPPAIFFDPSSMADHMQWKRAQDIGNSGRAAIAVAAGLWTDVDDWIATSTGTAMIRLTDTTGSLLHGPNDYEVHGAAMPLADPIPEPVAPGEVIVRLEVVATGLTAPNWGVAVPSQPDRLYVSDQNGILWAIELATGVKSVFLDVAARLVTLGVFGPNSFDERGLLGVAFHPDYTTNGLLYTYTSQPVSGVAEFSTMPAGMTANHQSVVTEWNVPNPTDPASVVDPGSARELLRIDEPQFNHNAGALNFGPDGMLYVSIGDGGGADDRDGQDFLGSPIIGHGLEGNGQNPGNVLGTILRIDPAGSDSANGQYGIPSDNPFVADATAIDEVFAFGFRNPFRFSFDALTGDLQVGDVGQNDIEEVDLVLSGGNYGWRAKEGSFFFDPNGDQPGFVTGMDPGVPGGLTDPIAQYDHDEGVAIIGGFVYRGLDIPGLMGRYVFGDFAHTFSNDGRLFYLDASNQVVELQFVDQAALNLSLLGFGQDAAGALYALANETGIPFGTTGSVIKIARVGFFGPPQTAPYPHDRRKNRYISFNPNKAENDGINVAFKVDLQQITLGSCGGNGGFCREDRGTADCNICSLDGNACILQPVDCAPMPPQTCDPTGDTCLNDAPDVGGTNVGHIWWVGPESPLGNGVHLMVSEPFRKVSDNWPNPTHVGDCEIVPEAIYGVRAVNVDTSDESNELLVETTLFASISSSWWTDVVGPLRKFCGGDLRTPECVSDGDCTAPQTCDRAWTLPDGSVNFDDVNAALALVAPGPTSVAPDHTWVDVHGNGTGTPGSQNFDPPNFVLNFADLGQILFGFQGRPYTFNDPADCPDLGGWP